MKLFFIILISILTNFYVLQSDTIYWADKLVGFSSQTGNKEYSANQAIGKPDIKPEQGQSACAWMPKLPTDRIEWIRVKFPRRIHVSRIYISENLNPGAITKIILYDSLGRGKLVFSNNKVANRPLQGRLSVFDIETSGFTSNEMKIEVNVTGYLENYQIDAIGISSKPLDYETKINHIQDTTEYVKEKLDSNINSIYSELAPIISSDGRTLVFTREGHPDNIGDKKKQDVWISRIDSNGVFQKAENIGPPINDENANFAISVSTNANSIFLGNIYLPDGNAKSGFSSSVYDGYTWSYPDSIIIKNYYNLTTKSSFCLANNGKILITAIKRNDSFGNTDLYVSFLDKDGTWTEPKNLGSQINTAAEELSPFLASDNKTLYFSTSGLPGYGDTDMFFSKRLDDTWTNWTEPVNLGPSINTEGWDAYYTVTADGNYAYFVSSNQGKTDEDIFRVRLPQLVKPETVVLIKGKVLNKKTNQAVSAGISYEILPEGIEAGITKSNPKTGEYSIVLPSGNQYGFLAEAQGYASINEFIDLTVINGYTEFNRDLYLVPIEKGQKVIINNIFFEFAKYELLPESFSELNRLVKLLEQNPNMKIRIEGHTDSVGNNSFNLRLSKQRAESVFNYLTLNGIDNKRIKIKGYGSSRPLTSNNSEEDMAKNRRVEFHILEE
ncbi:MAG: OmpA family protein [Candidatus Kapaibacterium sp.]